MGKLVLRKTILRNMIDRVWPALDRAAAVTGLRRTLLYHKRQEQRNYEYVYYLYCSLSVMTPCSLVSGHECFEWIYYLHLQDWNQFLRYLTGIRGWRIGPTQSFHLHRTRAETRGHRLRLCPERGYCVVHSTSLRSHGHCDWHNLCYLLRSVVPPSPKLTFWTRIVSHNKRIFLHVVPFISALSAGRRWRIVQRV
jgi:hypothetical protein